MGVFDRRITVRYPRVRSENAYCAAREDVHVALNSSSNFSVEPEDLFSNGVDRVERMPSQHV